MLLRPLAVVLCLGAAPLFAQSPGPDSSSWKPAEKTAGDPNVIPIPTVVLNDSDAAEPIPDEDSRPDAMLVIRAQAEEAAATTQAGPAGFGIRRTDATAAARSKSAGPSNVVSGGESRVRPATDLGSLLGKSESSSGVVAQKRSPIVTDTRVRGTKTGELQASGSYWLPARLDLDTMMSKIDSSIISEVIGIKGPYSSLYGPGFTFFDIGIADSPRYPDGPEWHGRTSVNYNTNGEQWYGRETILGGSADWGLRLGYGHRTGNDYDDGDGDNLPTSYKSRDIDGAFGFNLSDSARIEFNLLRLDQTDVEFAGQIFDIDFLVTDSFEVRYIEERGCWFDSWNAETWYNRTRFEGNAQRSGKRRQIPELNSVLQFVGFTDVDQLSSGFRIAGTWGDKDGPQLSIGADLRYVEMTLNEFDTFDAGGTGAPATSNFPIPNSHWSNPGVFVEHSWPVTECLFIKTGGRLDWISTDVEDIPDGRTAGELHDLLGSPNFDQNFDTWLLYLTSEYRIDPHTTLLASVGHGERAPTLTELYAVDPFLAILQQGFSQVRGDLNLSEARLWQIDLGMKWQYESFRASVGGFYGWIDEYITFEARDDGLALLVDGGLGVTYTNTDLATLAGFEASAEYQLNRCVTPFVMVSYVEGRDRSRGERGVIDASPREPLPGIAPLEARAGFRLTQPVERPRYGLEFTARVVENQDRVASSLLERESAGFTTYDLRAYAQVTDRLMLISGVENFTDKNYREHLDLLTGNGLRQPGISFYFGFELTY